MSAYLWPKSEYAEYIHRSNTQQNEHNHTKHEEIVYILEANE